MPDRKRQNAEDLRAATKLITDATREVTRIVRDMHRTIASGPAVLGRPLARPVDAVTGLVYGNVERVTDLVGTSLDAALMRLAPLLGESTPGPEREALLAVMNGVLGDLLVGPLAIPMTLRRKGRELPLGASALRDAVPEAGPRLLVLVHGACMTDLQWTRKGHDHGNALERDCGLTAIRLLYNTGLHVSTNGRAFAELLEELVRVWPVPVEELSIVGHSMGGLVARSALHAAEEQHLAWRRLAKRYVSIGTPHHGSPLERGGNLVDALLDATPYSAPLAKLGKIRSAGVTDLRYGNVLDEHWRGRERFERAPDARAPLPLPTDVACFAVAATRAPAIPEGASLRQLPGDGLVPVASALGRHTSDALSLGFPEARTFVVPRTTHLDLLASPEVYARLRVWFEGA